MHMWCEHPTAVELAYCSVWHAVEQPYSPYSSSPFQSGGYVGGGQMLYVKLAEVSTMQVL